VLFFAHQAQEIFSMFFFIGLDLFQQPMRSGSSVPTS
jgi:hypothetical protein